MIKKINKTITLIFGVGSFISERVHKQLGLNFRNSPIFVKKKHKENIENKFLKNQTGKILKIQINNFQIFKKKIK